MKVLEENTPPKKSIWLRQAGWGIFVHYLAAPASSHDGAEITAEAWNAHVDRFDVEGLADQLLEVGAGYLIFSLGQNSGHYCAPNPVYDELTGISPSKCSRRDIPAELAAALSERGIGLMLYLPSGAPDCDACAIEMLRWRKGERRHAEFQGFWEDIARYWSQHYGRSIRGWWIDGCYDWEGMYLAEDAPNATTFCSALRAGNSDSILAFNTGPRSPITALAGYEDYTAGELNTSLPVFDLQSVDGGYVDGVQFHALTYLGGAWGRGRPRFEAGMVAGYTRHIIAHGGVVSWDVPVVADGTLDPAFLPCLTDLPHSESVSLRRKYKHRDLACP